MVATDLVDEWRTQKLTISGVTRSVYSLTSGTQSYTIGTSGANFGQDYPAEIYSWSVIPDDDATDPVEQPRGRPLTFDEWQSIRVKSLDAAYPTHMWYDKRYSSGQANCLFWPIPDNGDVDVVLYSSIPVITSIVAATSYDLRHGLAMALKTNLAVELCDRYGREVPNSLLARARRSLAALKRANTIPTVARIRREYVIGRNRRGGFNVRTDS